MVDVRKVPEFMTVDAFLVWDAPDGAMWQLVNGVPEPTAPADGTQALIQNEVGSLIGNHLAKHRPGCRVLGHPGVIPRLHAEEHYRIPDIGVTCVPVPRGAVAISEPILLIEILSPGNTWQTWQNVWAYTTIPSVQEILVIRTASAGVQLLRRTPDGTWPEVPLAIEAGDVTLESIGFDVPVAALYTGTWLAEKAS
jgi:Uma2 family endonuclease